MLEKHGRPRIDVLALAEAAHNATRRPASAPGLSDGDPEWKDIKNAAFKHDLEAAANGVLSGGTPRSDFEREVYRLLCAEREAAELTNAEAKAKLEEDAAREAADAAAQPPPADPDPADLDPGGPPEPPEDDEKVN